MRVIGDDGTQYGVLTKEEALKKAQELGIDLVLVAPKVNPPVAKIIDFSKFKFQQEKKEQSSKKKTNIQELKELRLTPFMAENDLMVRVNRAKKFLSGGDKVRLTVWFRGRQITRKQFGYDILRLATEKLNDVAVVESEPKLRGKNLEMLLKPASPRQQRGEPGKKHESNKKTENEVIAEGPI